MLRRLVLWFVVLVIALPASRAPASEGLGAALQQLDAATTAWLDTGTPSTRERRDLLKIAPAIAEAVADGDASLPQAAARVVGYAVKSRSADAGVREGITTVLTALRDEVIDRLDDARRGRDALGDERSFVRVDKVVLRGEKLSARGAAAEDTRAAAAAKQYAKAFKALDAAAVLATELRLEEPCDPDPPDPCGDEPERGTLSATVDGLPWSTTEIGANVSLDVDGARFNEFSVSGFGDFLDDQGQPYRITIAVWFNTALGAASPVTLPGTFAFDAPGWNVGVYVLDLGGTLNAVSGSVTVADIDLDARTVHVTFEFETEPRGGYGPFSVTSGSLDAECMYVNRWLAAKAPVIAPVLRRADLWRPDEFAGPSGSVTISADGRLVGVAVDVKWMDDAELVDVWIETGVGTDDVRHVGQICLVDGAGRLWLGGADKIPSALGVASLDDLSGRRLELRDDAGEVRLAGVLPGSGSAASLRTKTKLRPDPGAPFPDATGLLKTKYSGKRGRSWLELDVTGVPPDTPLELWMQSSLGSDEFVWAADLPDAYYSRFTDWGDRLPGGLASVRDLCGLELQVRSGPDVVLTYRPPAPPRKLKGPDFVVTDIDVGIDILSGGLAIDADVLNQGGLDAGTVSLRATLEVPGQALREATVLTTVEFPRRREEKNLYVMFVEGQPLPDELTVEVTVDPPSAGRPSGEYWERTPGGQGGSWTAGEENNTLRQKFRRNANGDYEEVDE